MKIARASAVVAATVLAMLAACDSSSSSDSGGSFTFDGGVTINVAANPANLAIDPGGTATVDVTILGGATTPVDLSVSGLPLTIAAAFEPAQTTSATKLTIKAAPDATPGAYPFTVRGTVGGSSATATVTVTVNAPATAFDLAVSPASVSVDQGGTFGTEVNVVRHAGFTGPVDVTLDAPPAGFTAAPFTIPAGASAGVLNVATAQLVTPGVTTSLTVKGTSGAVTTSTKLDVKVTGRPGGLDTTFGTNGTVSYPTNANIATPYRVTQDPNGKILIFSYVYNGNVNDVDWVVLRYNADGTADNTFGTGGRVVIASPGPDLVAGGGVLANGSILVAGTQNGKLGFARLSSTGVLDNTFGTAGILIPQVDPGAFTPNAAAMANGKMVVVGGTPGGDIMVIRVNAADASYDTTFNTTGFVVSDIGGNAQASAVAFSGTTVTIAGIHDTDFLVARYTNGGALDTTFNTTGWKNVDFAGFSDWAQGIAIQGDGKIVVVGTAGVTSTLTKVGVARLTSAGALDATFATNGVIAVGGSQGDVGYAVALQPDGKILAGGSAVVNGASDMYTFRLTTAGALDTTWNGTGKAYQDFGSYFEAAYGYFLGADGRVTVAGYAQSPISGVVFARYWP